jgi:small-conductance mechanosensitive channel
VRSSGVIIASEVSLGYDVGYAELEPLLLRSAEECGLAEPFVHILKLDDFSVQYRVAGLLMDVSKILTARSNLNRQLLYTLHGAGIEIVSPTITRHITHSEETRILPTDQPAPEQEEGGGAEAIVFDKASEIETFTQSLNELTAQLEALGSEGKNTQRAETLRQQVAALKQRIEALQQQD